MMLGGLFAYDLVTAGSEDLPALRQDQRAARTSASIWRKPAGADHQRGSARLQAKGLQ